MIAALVLALATPSPTPSPSAPPTIERVRVATGSPQALHRLPFGASVLDAAQLQSQPAATSDAALRALPGFDRDRSNSGFTNYGQLRVSFAGAGTDRGVVLVDDIPAQDLFGGQVDWAAYPARDLTRAELLRGPGSALYGSGAIGGVLELDTFAPALDAARTPSGVVSVAAGTHQSVNNDLLASLRIAPKFAVALAASQQQFSYFDLPPAYQTPIDRPASSTASAIDLKFRYAAAQSTSLEYGYRGAWDVQQEGRPNYDFWRNLIEHRLSFAHAWTNASLVAAAYVRNGFVTNRADQPKAPGTLLYTQYVPTHETGVVAQWTVDNANATFAARANLRSGGGASDQLNAANAITTFGSGNQQLADFGIQQTWRFRRGEFVAGVADSVISLRDAQLFAAGKTLTIVPRTDRAASPRGALRYDLSRTLAFRMAAGSGFRAPFLNELVRGYIIGPIAFLPNPNLVPERSSSLTAGFDWSRGASELSADVTHTFVNDAIGFITVDPTHQIRTNIAHTQTDGAIVTYANRLTPCGTVTLSATQQNARVTAGNPATIGKKLPYVPETAASASIDMDSGATSLGVTIAYLGMTYADDLNLQPLGTALTLGVRASMPLGDRARLIISGNNLTDARYLSSIDRIGPPATYAAGLEIPAQRRETTCR